MSFINCISATFVTLMVKLRNFLMLIVVPFVFASCDNRAKQADEDFEKGQELFTSGVADSSILLPQNLPSDESEPPQVPNRIDWKREYAGSYSIEVDSISSSPEMEVYVLHEDGSAKRIYLVSDFAGGARIHSEKSGLWDASQYSISITVQDNSGLITETYSFRGGRFVNERIDDRYLKPTRDYK